jgi:hypothetical protein
MKYNTEADNTNRTISVMSCNDGIYNVEVISLVLGKKCLNQQDLRLTQSLLTKNQRIKLVNDTAL